MIRESLSRLALLVSLAVVGFPLLAKAQEPADAGPLVFEHVFGGTTREDPGFVVTFDRRGAGVVRVLLLDQRESAESDDPYTLVFTERTSPSDPNSAVQPWMQIREVELGRMFPALAQQGGLAVATWDVARIADDVVSFTISDGGGLVLEKTFRHERGRRDLIVELALEAAADRDAQDVGAAFRFDLDGVGLSSPRSDYVFGGSASMAVGAVVLDDDVVLNTHKATGGALEERAVLAERPDGGLVGFAGNTNRFFGAFLYPDGETAAAALLGAEMFQAPGREQLDTPSLSVPVARFWLTLPVPAAGAESRAQFRYYMGPKSYTVFETQPDYERFDPVMRAALAQDFCCPIPLASDLAVFLLWLLGVLESIVGNWGFAIVCLTILVRGALVPLNFRMQKSMRAYGSKMAVLKPKLDELQKRYQNDKQQLQQAMIAFQREHKMFPPLGGCLPMFVTIPIFIGLFTALRVSYDLRLEPFVLWIDDLSRPDHLIATGIDFLPWFNLLPIIMVVLWWWLQHGTPLPKDPQQRQVMKIMRFMPLVFGVMLYQYASGLMVYMITSSAFGLVEQRITRRILGPVDPDAAGVGATPMI